MKLVTKLIKASGAASPDDLFGIDSSSAVDKWRSMALELANIVRVENLYKYMPSKYYNKVKTESTIEMEEKIEQIIREAHGHNKL